MGKRAMGRVNFSLEKEASEPPLSCHELREVEKPARS